MRFVSKHRGYSAAIRPPQLGGYNAAGDPYYTAEAMNANFQQGGLSPWEIDEALEHWGEDLPGVADGEDRRQRFSVFDTEWAALEFGWNDADREFAEQRLLTLPGRLGNEYIRVEDHKAPAPWPTYKTFSSPDAIVRFMREGGYDPEVVLRFERENASRDDVLEAVENAGHEDVTQHEVVVKA